MERNEQSVGRRSTLEKGSRPLVFEKRPSTVDFVARQNLASVLEHHGSSRRSMSESALVNPNLVPHKQFHNEEEYTAAFKILKSLEGDKCKEIEDCSMMQNSTQAVEQRTKPQDRDRTGIVGSKPTTEVISTLSYSDFSKPHTKQVIGNFSSNDDIVFPDPDGKSVGLHQFYEAKLASLIRKNSTLEERLAAALASKEGAERNLSFVVKSRQDMENKLGDTVREMELLKVKLSSVDLAQEEANSLSNIVHSDNVRLEHDVAFLKAVLDDTQKELHSIRGVFAGKRARAFQLQDLTSQVSAETDPVALLPKVVSLLYLQVHNKALQAPGRAISVTDSKLKGKLEDAAYKVLSDYHAPTVTLLALLSAAPDDFDPAKLRKLRPSFKEVGGSVTAGNASSIRHALLELDPMGNTQLWKRLQ